MYDSMLSSLASRSILLEQAQARASARNEVRKMADILFTVFYSFFTIHLSIFLVPLLKFTPMM